MNTSPCVGCQNPSAESPDQLERRHLLKRGVLAAVATTLGATLSTTLGACARAAAPVTTVPLGKWALRVRTTDFPGLADVWGIARVDGESDKPVAVVHTPDGFAAFSLRCPHAGATVEPKGGMFVCPGHGAEFKADGTWTGGHRAKNLVALATTYDPSTKTLTITG